MSINDLLEKINPALIDPDAQPATPPPTADTPADQEPDAVPADDEPAVPADEPPADPPADEPPADEPEVPAEPDKPTTTEKPAPVEPKPVAVTPPPPATPADAPPPQPSASELDAKIARQRELRQQIQAKKADGSFDPIDDQELTFELTMIQGEIIELQEAEKQQSKAEGEYWQNFETKYEKKVPADRARSIFNEEFQKAQAAGWKGRDAETIATHEMHRRAKQIVSQPPKPRTPAPAAPPVPVTPKGGKVTPPGNPARPPSKPRTPEEELAARIKPQDVRNFLR